MAGLGAGTRANPFRRTPSLTCSFTRRSIRATPAWKLSALDLKLSAADGARYKEAVPIRIQRSK
jgi:hypothetical protein